MRLLLEAVGVLLALASHAFLLLLYAMGSILRAFRGYEAAYASTIVLGHLAILVALVLANRRAGIPGRALLDLYLVTFLTSFLVCWILVLLNWPIRARGWDGHGMGASGGEGNSLLLPWLQLGGLFCALRFSRRTKD